MPEIQRRLPALKRKVSDIKPEDIRVSILGMIIDKQENTVVLDDGTGKVKITFDQPVNFNMNQLVRIFGRVVPIENSIEIQGEIIQDMSKLDLDLYKKVEKLEGIEHV